MADRAIIFIDGNNWFHALCEIGVRDRARLDYVKISEKLVGPREWIATRYYIGQVNQKYNSELYARQRSFLASLENADDRISVHLGRIEPRIVSNPAAKELREYLANLPVKLDPMVFAALSDLAKRHEETPVFIEKAVDVSLAVDVVSFAISDSYDAAYLLTADGDFTPAVDAVRRLGKKVFAVSPLSGAQLARRVNSFIHLKRSWFDDCYRD
jgi:hypothetical protein